MSETITTNTGSNEVSTSNAILLEDKESLWAHVEHARDERGFVDWKSLIDPKHIVLNTETVLKKGIALDNMSSEEIEEYKASAPESDLLIKLAGFKDLMKLRGYIDAYPEVLFANDEKVIIRYVIVWLPNFETRHKAVKTAAVASASVKTTTGKFQNFLETIAENRALVRCVKNFLNIHILGQDELPIEDNIQYVSSGDDPSVYSQIKEVLKQNNYSFEQLKKSMIKKNLPGAESLKKIEDIDPSVALIVLKMLKDKNG